MKPVQKTYDRKVDQWKKELRIIAILAWVDFAALLFAMTQIWRAAL